MLEESKKCLQSTVFKTPGDARGLMNRAGANGDQLKPFIALTKQCANHCHPLSFPLFSVNMKGLVPTVTSNVAAAGPIPGHGVSLSPSPPHIKPQLTKEALGGIMRRTTPFNYV